MVRVRARHVEREHHILDRPVAHETIERNRVAAGGTRRPLDQVGAVAALTERVALRAAARGHPQHEGADAAGEVLVAARVDQLGVDHWLAVRESGVAAGRAARSYAVRHMHACACASACACACTPYFGPLSLFSTRTSEVCGCATFCATSAMPPALPRGFSLSRSQDNSTPKYPSVVQITQRATVSESTLDESTSNCLGAYELQQGHMAHGRPVWKQPGQARAIAYLGNGSGWGVQPLAQVGASSIAWLHLEAPELALPCEPTAKVWKSIQSSGWVTVEQLECVVLGPPPKLLQLGPDDPRLGCGLYELKVGRTVNGGPVWLNDDGAFVVARISSGTWVAQHEADCGEDMAHLMLRARGSVPFPCDWGVWEATVDGTWTPDPELRCLDVGPTPKVLLMETEGCRLNNAKSAAGVYELQAKRTAYDGPVWKQAGADAGWCVARLPKDLGWGVQPEASVGAPLGSGKNWGTVCCLILRAPQLVYPCLESPHKWESLHPNARGAELSVKCVNPPRPRFPVGTRVVCSYNGSFEPGIVVRHHYRYAPPHGRWARAYCLMCSARHLSLRRQNGFEPTELMPYQVRLDEGILIYAPVDEDSHIRAERNQDQEVSLAAIVHHIVHHTVHSMAHHIVGYTTSYGKASHGGPARAVGSEGQGAGATAQGAARARRGEPRRTHGAEPSSPARDRRAAAAARGGRRTAAGAAVAPRLGQPAYPGEIRRVREGAGGARRAARDGR